MKIAVTITGARITARLAQLSLVACNNGDDITSSGLAGGENKISPATTYQGPFDTTA